MEILLAFLREEGEKMLIKVSWPTLNVLFLKHQGLDLKHQ